MAKYNVWQRAPARAAEADARQAELRKRYAGVLTRDMLCDYCRHTVGIYLKGSHSPAALKCPKCGETTIFEPVSFRLSI